MFLLRNNIFNPVSPTINSSESISPSRFLKVNLSMPVRKIFLILLFFILCSCEIISQQFPFINYTPHDGLVNNRVRSMYQDSKGRLYFLTYGGLSVYDGARFINYGQAEGLTLPVVNDMLEITPDSFWVATNSPELHGLVHGKIKNLATSDGFY